jgi:hypothetical protein
MQSSKNTDSILTGTACSWNELESIWAQISPLGVPMGLTKPGFNQYRLGKLRQDFLEAGPNIC